ncbi:PREDICTED: zonadhesin-like [Thamnophis sirtalis]|uniref:Zonadhesin-like n=1 Tax=Thamnophis sirtalis TaxID=35019 RepID=A0A6I9YSX2_9SAUR|nr:PREDICTED: zonadhesin-like [Thamnophis sirtalis]
MDPFCGWRESMNNTWKRTNQNTPTEDTGPPGDYPHGEGYYIYVEGGQLKPNGSTRLYSSSFCISQEACVEFYYHMHSVVEVETQLQVLLEDPSGSAVLLWNRTGTQSPNWLHGSVTLPYTRAQPSKVVFEVIRGRNAYLDVSLDNILVHKGHCAEHPPTPVPPSTIATAPTTTVGPNITVPTGTATTPIITSTAVGPNITVPIGTAATPITTSTAIQPNITIPTETATTPITTSTAVGPNITVPIGTAATPITTSTAIQPNITVPTGTAATPITNSTAMSPNITVPIGTAATPITTSTAIQPNITVPTGTAATPITNSTAVGPNITVPTGTASTPITTSTAVHPNITVPIGTASTPITTSTAVHPNITVPTGTASTPITTSTAVHPNITIPTGTATTPITTSTAVGPNITIPTGTATTPITTSTAVGPNITIPTRTASTPITTTKPTTQRPGVDQTTPEQPPDSASCIVSGDPHYTTYDGRLFHFMGNCTYLLTATCNATPDQPTFQIQTTNEHRGSNTKVSYLKSVNITVHGTEIVLLKGRRVTVDGKRVTLPVSLAGGRVSVRLSGTFVRVQTDFGLSVRFDGNHHAEVSVPSSYFGKLCGLCGNFNGQAGDDNLMADGTSAGADANQLGKSWQVPNIGDASCTDSKDPEKCHPDIAEEAQGPTSCGILTDPQAFLCVLDLFEIHHFRDVPYLKNICP